MSPNPVKNYYWEKTWVKLLPSWSQTSLDGLSTAWILGKTFSQGKQLSCSNSNPNHLRLSGSGTENQHKLYWDTRGSVHDLHITVNFLDNYVIWAQETKGIWFFFLKTLCYLSPENEVHVFLVIVQLKKKQPNLAAQHFQTKIHLWVEKFRYS